ncbi:exo-alpha-sialidase [Nonomuraea phyllanthi]|uniref:sialidase family protein n=1 Tax=Nonomuraea phyllanthi TaxID=2219224 RepID=UPI001293650A|nr:sialidase family protein [Nonomuraea phyllanthi]QFY08953.1 exo-alpha-sialidase [Nonomuraea phyllanthi]
MPSPVPSLTGRRMVGGLLTVTLLLTPAAALASSAVPLTELGTDSYANATSQHGTQAGPDTFHAGTTIVAAQQAGRFFDGGASGIAFAASADDGATWTRGVLPGITAFGGGPYQRVSDPSVAFDARHGVWLISSLALTDTRGVTGAAVLTSRSTDGGLTWDEPVTTAVAGEGDLDKSWIACDNTPRSPYHGRCYTVFDDAAAGHAVTVSRSTDGGLTWEASATSGTGLGGQPVVRPDGAVVVPYLSREGQIRSLRSRDGGESWGASELVATVRRHTVAGGLRATPLPSAETDAAGTVYVAWHDCRFQLACGGNDIVMSTSATGEEWGHVTRVTQDGGDHVIPGLGVDPASSGDTARLAVTYYRYPAAACTAATCRLTVGYTSSANGGATWSPPVELHGPMELGWLANSAQGRMAGDYLSTSVLPGGNAFVAFTAAGPPSGGAYSMRTYTVTGGLDITGGGPAPLSIEAPVAPGEPSPTLPATVR